LIHDSIASYAQDITAFHRFYLANGGQEFHHTHPGPILGWGHLEANPANQFVRVQVAKMIIGTLQSSDQQQ